MAPLLQVGRCWAATLCFGLAGASPHGHIQAQVQTRTAHQHYLPNSGSPGARRVATAPAGLTCPEVHANAAWGPLRISYDFVDLSGTGVPQSPSQVVDFFMSEIMRRAARFYSEALEVRQATGPLMADWTFGSCTSFSFDPEPVCSSAERPVCGSDGVRIPETHLKAARTCSDRCSPSFNCNGACQDGQQCKCDATAWQQQRGDYCCHVQVGQCGQSCTAETASFVDLNVPPGARPLCETCTSTPAGEGVVGADIQLYVTMVESPNCNTAEAYAEWCAKDQCDRPIFGHINFCPSKMPSANPGTWAASKVREWISVAIHEIGHALGFSSSLYKYFRNSDGTPIIARDPDNPDAFANEVRWSCVPGGYTYPLPSGTQKHVDISPEIVAVEPADGSAACECPLAGRTTMGSGCLISSTFPQVPSCNVLITTPTVVQEVRDFFGCPSLVGARLENQDSQRCDFIGSHWDKRLFKDDVMEPGVSTHVYVSRLTLALFQDTGWYRANMDRADQPAVGVTWGYKQGCSFVNEKCIQGGVASTPSHFCTSLGRQGCNLGLFERSVCEMKSPDWPGSIPSFLDFFNGRGEVGQYDRLDYCPTMRGFENGLCSDESSSPRWEVGGSKKNLNLEVYSPSSRCFEGDLMASGYVPTWYPSCYETRCSEDGASYTLWVSAGTDSTAAAERLGECTRDGQELSGSSLPGQLAGGKVVCAAPAVICSTPVITFHLAGATRTWTTSTASTSTGSTATTTSFPPGIQDLEADIASPRCSTRTAASIVTAAFSWFLLECCHLQWPL